MDEANVQTEITSDRKEMSPEMTPEMIERFQKFLKREDKKNDYNRLYMQKKREDKEAYNKYQRDLYHKRKAKLSSNALECA